MTGDAMTFQYGMIPFRVTNAAPLAAGDSAHALQLAQQFARLATEYNLTPSWLTIFTSRCAGSLTNHQRPSLWHF